MLFPAFPPWHHFLVWQISLCRYSRTPVPRCCRGVCDKGRHVRQWPRGAAIAAAAVAAVTGSLMPATQLTVVTTQLQHDTTRQQHQHDNDTTTRQHIVTWRRRWWSARRGEVAASDGESLGECEKVRKQLIQKTFYFLGECWCV